jgi:hypothetical protein
MHKGNNKEESVEELLQKLAKKGKKVKLLDDSASVKELPRHEEADDSGQDINDRGEIPIASMEEMSPSKIKKKISKIKEERDDEQHAQS